MLALAVITALGFALRWRHDVTAPLLALASAFSLPLAYLAAQSWSRSSRMGLFAAIFMAFMPAAIHFGAISIAHAAAPALVLWALWLATKDSLRVQPTSFVLLALMPACVVVLMGGAGHFVLRWPTFDSVWRSLSALTLAYRVGEMAAVLPALIAASSLLGCIAARVIHQKEFAVKRSPLQLRDLALPTLMIAFALIASAAFISPTAFDGAVMVVASPALVLLLAWSFEGLILEPRAQLPSPSTPETQSQRYGLVAIAALALLAVYWRAWF